LCGYAELLSCQRQYSLIRLKNQTTASQAEQIVRYVPIATDALQQTASLFDHLVGGSE
jgi:hypothetical protein